VLIVPSALSLGLSQCQNDLGLKLHLKTRLILGQCRFSRLTPTMLIDNLSIGGISGLIGLRRNSQSHHTGFALLGLLILQNDSRFA
jgi:hypothetical protein